MKKSLFFRVIFLILLSIVLTSCRINKVYTSGSYTGLKSYSERPIYKGKKESANYLSGGVKKGTRSQVKELTDDIIAGSFSFHRATTFERFKVY